MQGTARLDQECSGSSSSQKGPPPAAPSPAATAPPAGANALELYDDNGNGRITCAEARKHGIAPVHRGHPAYAYMRDGDGDGTVCE